MGNVSFGFSWAIWRQKRYDWCQKVRFLKDTENFSFLFWQTKKKYQMLVIEILKCKIHIFLNSNICFKVFLFETQVSERWKSIAETRTLSPLHFWSDEHMLAEKLWSPANIFSIENTTRSIPFTGQLQVSYYFKYNSKFFIRPTGYIMVHWLNWYK